LKIAAALVIPGGSFITFLLMALVDDRRYEGSLSWFLCFLALFQLRFFEFGIKSFLFKIGADQEEKTHVNIGHPDQGES
jgi:hypothetical protein